MWNELVRNWKTSIAALIVGIGAFVKLCLPGKDALVDRAAEVLILVGPVIGLLLAKDSDKSGTYTAPNP